MIGLRSRYATWSTTMLRVAEMTYAGTLLGTLFAAELAAMRLELLARDLPDLAAQVGGHLVAPGWGLE